MFNYSRIVSRTCRPGYTAIDIQLSRIEDDHPTIQTMLNVSLMILNGRDAGRKIEAELSETAIVILSQSR
jgi:hypothetical protein